MRPNDMDMFEYQVHLEDIQMEDINRELRMLAEQEVLETADLVYEDWLNSLLAMMREPDFDW